jgi:hypothetical protein
MASQKSYEKDGKRGRLRQLISTLRVVSLGENEK